MTKIDIIYHRATDDWGQCIIEIEEEQVHEVLINFRHLFREFREELQQASFSEENGCMIIAFLAPKHKIEHLEKIIQEAQAVYAQFN